MSSSSVPRRSLLTSLSPIGSYTLTNALGFEESGGDSHIHTLVHPPHTGVIRAESRENRREGDAKVIQKAYVIYTNRMSVCLREIEAEREDHDGTILFENSFNSIPIQVATDLGRNKIEQTRILVGFANGAIFMFNPFTELIRRLNLSDTEESTTTNHTNINTNPVTNISPLLASSSSSLPLPSPSPSLSSSSFVASDRTFHTGSNVTPSKVTCLTWIPRRGWNSTNLVQRDPQTTTYSDEFLVGLDDGRMLVFDTRIEKEARLEHPSERGPILSKAELKQRSKVGGGGGGQIWQKEFFSIVHAPSMNGTQNGLPLTNPTTSWKIHHPPPNAFKGGITMYNTPPKIIALDFTVTGRHLGVALSSGYVLVFDWFEESMVACFRTHYGSPTCLRWTIDGRYLLSGGEDDLLCVWDPFVQRRCIMIGEGHDNFLTAIQVRPIQIEFEEDQAGGTDGDTAGAGRNSLNRNIQPSRLQHQQPSQPRRHRLKYSAVSVGQDKLLIFWEFTTPNDDENEGDETTQTGTTNITSTTSLPGIISPKPIHSTVITKEIVVDRPLTPATSTAASATSTSAPDHRDISRLFIPFRRSLSEVIYPMAKNIVSERAISDLSSGLSYVMKLQQQEWVRKLQTSGDGGINNNHTNINTTNPSYSSSHSGSPSFSSSPSSCLSSSSLPTFLPPEDDLLLTACHGHHIKLWTRIPATVDESDMTQPSSAPALLSIPSSSSGGSGSSSLLSSSSSSLSPSLLTSRVMRLNTPVLSTFKTNNQGRRG